MGLPTLKLRIASMSEDELTLYLFEEPGPHYRAIISVKKYKTKLREVLKLIGDENAYVSECGLREGAPVNCGRELVQRIDEKFPGVGEAFLAEYRRVLNEWDRLLELERLKREETKLLEGISPIHEDEVEGKVVRILASDGVHVDPLGSFIDLGDLIIVSESTFAYVETEAGNASIERIEPVGVVVAYKRGQEGITPVERKWFYPRQQARVVVGGKLVRIKAEGKDVAMYASTFAEVSTLEKVVNGEALEAEWAAIGGELAKRLREYVVIDDERLYDVLASYAIMTYFYDFFYAVPFLWLHGPPGSGKTRANVTVTFMCRHGIFVADPSEATLYRLVEAVTPTLGIDESVLSERAKRILAAGYKKGATVPRAEPTKGGIVLKLFEATAPRIFSFEQLPTEDYLLQRIIAVNMLRAKPQKFMEPLPTEFKDIREKLYYLRLTAVPQILEAKDKALKTLENSGVWGREAEIWAPVLTAAILTGRDQPVLNYILEDISRRRTSELMYDEEKAVLAAIDELFSINKPLDKSEDRELVFKASDLQTIIIKQSIDYGSCLDENGRDDLCRKQEEELKKKWKSSKIGLVLKNLGFERFKSAEGKGKNARYVYKLPYKAFINIAKRYDYEPDEKESGEES